MFHRAIAGGEHFTTAGDLLRVFISSQIPIERVGVIRVGKIMSFPTKAVQADPNGARRPCFSSFFFSFFQTWAMLSFYTSKQLLLTAPGCWPCAFLLQAV